ncbi:MAG: hypothetical protein Q9224_005864 [Gallowayella concinna]
MAFINRSISNEKTQPVHTVPARVLPKRKRKETSYYPSDSEFSDPEAFASDIDHNDMPIIKKAKVAATTVITRPLPKKKIFPFLSLPPELKNKIYDYALVCENELDLISSIISLRRVVRLGDTEIVQINPWSIVYRQPSLRANLLLLNKQMHAETQPILYGANRFALEEMKTLHTFCSQIGPKNCASLQQLSIKSSGSIKYANYAAFATLASAVNLTRLDIDCEVYQNSHPGKKLARGFYREAHLWLEAVGTAKGRRDAAVELLNVDLHHPEYSCLSLEAAAKAEIIIGFRKELRVLLHNA